MHLSVMNWNFGLDLQRSFFLMFHNQNRVTLFLLDGFLLCMIFVLFSLLQRQLTHVLFDRLPLFVLGSDGWMTSSLQEQFVPLNSKFFQLFGGTFDMNLVVFQEAEQFILEVREVSMGQLLFRLLSHHCPSKRQLMFFLFVNCKDISQNWTCMLHHRIIIKSNVEAITACISCLSSVLYYMASNRNSESRDILDQYNQTDSRLRGLPTNMADSNARQDLMMKNLYKQQLDDLMRQKEEQKKRLKQQEMQERQSYNERLNYGKEAERLKDLSYKNYYQLLLDNQNKMSQHYQGLNSDRDNLKQTLIQKGIEQERQRSQKLWEMEQARLQNERKNYRQQLDREINQKQMKNNYEREEKYKLQEEYKRISYTPAEVAKIERERKLLEMNKYKEDLEKSSPTKGEKTRMMTGSSIIGFNSNDFNTSNYSYHNPMTNPLPYNIQNPYILKEMMRKQPSRPY